MRYRWNIDKKNQFTLSNKEVLEVRQELAQIRLNLRGNLLCLVECTSTQLCKRTSPSLAKWRSLAMVTPYTNHWARAQTPSFRMDPEERATIREKEDNMPGVVSMGYLQIVLSV